MSGGAGHASAVTAALRAYADRGVFRGFTATLRARDRTAYEFHWLLRPPMRAVFDDRAGTLAFPAIVPGVDRSSPMVAGLNALVASRTTRALPAHKRLDARRARVSATVHRGDWSLTVTIRGANHAYAVQRALNLINELFLFLHESHPEYLIERFGLSQE
jgi:hypothetical protein